MLLKQTQDKNKMLVRRLYEDCFNTGNLEVLAELLARDFTGGQGEKGSTGFGAIIAGLRRGFPDAHFTLEDMFAEDDRVAVRWSLTATHKGPFAGVAASHKAVAQTAIAIYRIVDGKIHQAWLQADRLGLRQQIGGAPA
ncbi:ester cyclase [Undibacterium sp.]|uniref:ester cyclase n=1 Tax=Undibacterium sp. TaxID=1914977 RepID=UPI002BA839FB|nr:ester cyclase [Undibacterium sp.]HTD04460.1 ester cyclase [Undibacterium sp.]